jgi:hypothetical protein
MNAFIAVSSIQAVLVQNVLFASHRISTARWACPDLDRVYGVAPSLAIETSERDLRAILAEVPGVARVDVVLGDDPFR